MEQQRKPSWLKKKPESTTDWMLIIFASITFYMVISNAGYVVEQLEGFMAILTPFAAGIVIAYIINPVVVWAHRYICRGHARLKWLAMLIGYIIAIVVVAVMCYLISEQVVKAIFKFSENFGVYQTELVTMLTKLGEWEHWPENLDVTVVTDYVSDLSNIAKSLITWLTDQVNMLDTIFSNVKDTFVLGFTAIASSIYLLSQKDKLLRHTKILVRAFMPRKLASNVLRICHQANRNLSGFFSGKIIDSAIIGVLTYICMMIFGMREFAPVISIIVGVTNIIPVFGPFIGAIPGILLLLFTEPLHALGFAVLILVIQQLDGNVIGPKILGDAIGVDALWVLVSIVVGGELMGLPGMVIGVPAFATMMSVVKELAEWCLRYQGIDKDGNPLKEGETPPDPFEDDKDSDADGSDSEEKTPLLLRMPFRRKDQNERKHRIRS